MIRRMRTSERTAPFSWKKSSPGSFDNRDMGGSSPPAGWKVRSRRFLLATLFWSAIGCLFGVPIATSDPGWRRSLLSSLGQWWSWGLLTPAIFALDRWLPVSNKLLAHRVLAHLIPSFLFTAAYVYVFAAV